MPLTSATASAIAPASAPGYPDGIGRTASATAVAELMAHELRLHVMRAGGCG